MRTRLTVAALLTLAALPGASEAQATPPPEARQIAAVVDTLIRADLAEFGVPGAAFVFVRDGRIVYQQGNRRDARTDFRQIVHRANGAVRR